MADLDVAVTLSGRDAGLSSVTTAAAASLAKLQEAADQSTTIMDRLWGSFQQGIGIAAGFRVFEAIGGLFSSAAASAIGFNQQIDAASSAMGKFFDSQESVTNSLKNLQDLANKTPFAFEGMVTAQQRTIGAARSADELKQNMDAITVVAANTGRVSSANMDRISLALGQMQAKGHLAGGEMLQLTEAGVNMGEILSKHFGVTTAAIVKMSEQGKISSQDVFQAMREYASDPKNRQALDGLAKTFEGAMSTIKDVTQSTIAATFRPLFDMLTAGANLMADFLQSDNFKVWAEAVRIGFQGAVEGLQAFLGLLAPLGQAISTAFGQLTQGDFSGAFATLTSGFTAQLQSIWDGITAFASSMLGAGENVVGQFAEGIISGAEGVLQGAVDVVANLIASFLVGNSPPPAGPLSQIDQAGTKLMETYGTGMQQGLGPSKQAVTMLADSIRDVGRSIDDLTTQHNDLKNQVDDVKRSYDDQIRPLQEQLDIIKQKSDAADKEAQLQFKVQEANLKQLEFEAKGDPVRRAEIQQQLALLGQKEKELGLEDSIADVQRQRQKIAEDGTKAQLEQIQYETQRAALLKQMHEADQKNKDDNKNNNVDESGLQARLKELDLRHQISEQTRKEADADAQRRLGMLDVKGQELGLQKDLADLTDTSKLGEIAKDKELLQSTKDQYDIAKNQAEIEKAQQVSQLQQQIHDIKNDEGDRVRVLQEQMALIDRQKQGLEDQRKALTAQKSEMAEMLAQQKEAEAAAKKAGAGTGAAIPGAPSGGIHFDLTAAQKEAEDAVKVGGAHLAQSLSEGASTWLHDNFWTLAIGAIGAVGGAGIGASIGAALFSFIPVFGTAFGALIGGAIGAGIGGLSVAGLATMVAAKFREIVGAPLGDVVSALITELRQTFATEGWGGIVLSVLEILGLAVQSIAGKLAGWASALLDWVGPTSGELLDNLANMLDAIYDWIGESSKPIGEKLVSWELAFLGWLGTAGLELMTKLANLIGGVLGWIGTQTIVLTTKLLDWATAFVAWVGPKIPVLLTELGKLVASTVEWMGAHLGDLLDALGKWAVEFVNWVGPKIPPLLIELGKLLVSLTDWTINTALPAIAEKLLEWGKAIIAWVEPRIGPLLLELGKILLALTEWVYLTALPAIVLQLGKWGLAFVEWLFPQTEPMLTALGNFLTSIGTWIKDTALQALVLAVATWGPVFVDWVQHPVTHIEVALDGLKDAITGWVTNKIADLKTSAAEIGQGMLEGIQDGISNNVQNFKDWLKEHFADELPNWLKDMLGIHSPSAMMVPIGQALVDGIISGMEDRVPLLRQVLDGIHGIVGGGGSGGGDALGDDALRGIASVATGITGVGSGWIDDLVWLAIHESGGIPNNRNQTGVGPGGSGEHAEGLMQTIPSTFEAYRLGDLPDDIDNPLANMVASIRYIQEAYDGDIRSVVDGWEERGGYATGGIAWHKQLAWVGENEPEVIIPFSKIPDASSSARASSGPDNEALAKAIAGALAPLISRTRPIIQQGTAEDLVRQTRRVLERNAKDYESLRGVRR